MRNITVWKLCTTKDKTLQIHELKFSPFCGTLDIATQVLPAGAYTTFRTYALNKVLHLEKHFQRLERSAQLSGIPLRLDRMAVRKAMAEIIESHYQTDTRIRLTLDLERQVGEVYFALEPLQTPDEEAYQKGVAVITCRLERKNAQAKLTDFLAQADQIRRNLPDDIHEAIMIDAKGRILEGLSSNFFAIKNRTLFTAGENILPGITRAIVLDEARKEGIPILYEAVAAGEATALDEAFITSSSRGILPVVQIDRSQVGSGLPGAITRRLMQRLEQRIQEEIEEIRPSALLELVV